ncbi:MAG: ATPase [Bacteroidetes bacterium]|jgi:mercuric ion binding protein|nr:ATPase [Bacteroidota bacterium]
MKNIFLALLMVGTLGVFAKTVTQKILVKGECGKCKDKIEAALDIPGISFAEWDKETKMLTIRYNDKKISESQIHTTISNLGYATSTMAANPEAQAALDNCCKPKEAKACGAKAGCCKKKS